MRISGSMSLRWAFIWHSPRLVLKRVIMGVCLAFISFRYEGRNMRLPAELRVPGAVNHSRFNAPA